MMSIILFIVMPILFFINAGAKSTQGFDCSLDGPEVSSMDSCDFVAKLHSLGKRVEDSVIAQIKKAKTKTYQAIQERTALSNNEWLEIRSALKLKGYRSLSGYQEDTIVFADNVNSEIAPLVKVVFKKFNVPLGIKVTQEVRNKEIIAEAIASANSGPMRYTLNLNPLWWGSKGSTIDDDELQRKREMVSLAHEATHFLKYHGLKRSFLVSCLKNKEVNEGTIKECSILLSTFHEYEAELLMLKYIEYAQYQFYRCLSGQASDAPHESSQEGEVKCLYPPVNLVKTLAYRAVVLHQIEQELLKEKEKQCEIPEFLFWGGAC